MALLLVAAALAPGCRPDGAHPGDVLLITVDTLRPDHIGLYGYHRPTTPNLDRWLADAAIFDRAYSTAAYTAASVCSLLSGRLPQDHRVRLIWQLVPPEIPWIPRLLPATYQTAAFVSSTVLTDEAMGVATRFDHYDDFVDERESKRLMFQRSAARTVDAAVRWLREERAPERPVFLWLHLMDPHAPYSPPPDWPLSFSHERTLPLDPDRIKPFMRLADVDDAFEYVDMYDEEIAYMDHHLDRLFRAYSELESLDEALVIVTADHGESLLEREEWFRHGYNVYEEVVKVPLLVKAPGIRSGRHPGPASTIDVLPTVLAWTGAPVPDELPGIDLSSPGSVDVRRSILFEAAYKDAFWRAELRGDLKWVVRLTRGDGEIKERLLYDLAVDPGEQNPLPWSAREARPRRLLELCRADPDPGGLPLEYGRGERLKGPKVSTRADPEAIEALRTLGYVD